jgi:hypothetical protein
MKNTGHKVDADDKLESDDRLPRQGTRISTYTDVLVKNLWIAWIALEKAFKGSERSSRKEKPMVEKEEAGK